MLYWLVEFPSAEFLTVSIGSIVWFRSKQLRVSVALEVFFRVSVCALAVVVTRSCGSWAEVRGGADVCNVLVVRLLQPHCKSALIPRYPSKAVDLVARAIQSRMQVANVESVVRVSAAGVPTSDAELGGESSMTQGFA